MKQFKIKSSPEDRILWGLVFFFGSIVYAIFLIPEVPEIIRDYIRDQKKKQAKRIRDQKEMDKVMNDIAKTHQTQEFIKLLETVHSKGIDNIEITLKHKK